MWKLYDDLYIGIPSGIRITGCVVGEKWTCVSANGNVGIARTLGYPAAPEKFSASFIGAYLRDTGNYMKWDSPVKASVGMAALNAWYNTQDRAESLCGGEASALSMKKTAYVGDYCGTVDEVFPLPKTPDFDKASYLGLKDYDAVVISADALTAKVLPGLLDVIGEKGNVILEGYSLPCTALFFAFDMPVKELRGYYARFQEKLLSCAVDGKDPAPGVLPFIVKPLL